MSDMKAKAEEIFGGVPFPEAEAKGTDIPKTVEKEGVKIQGLKRKMFKIQGLAIAANATNPFHHNNYISLEYMVGIITPLLNKYELLVFHKVQDCNLVTVIEDIETGETESSSLPIPLITKEKVKDEVVFVNSKPQDLGSAITYFKRYNIGALLNIVTDKDDDGNASSVEIGVKTITQQAPVKHNPAPAPMNQSAPLGKCGTCNSPLSESKNGGSPWCVTCWKNKKK